MLCIYNAFDLSIQYVHIKFRYTFYLLLSSWSSLLIKYVTLSGMIVLRCISKLRIHKYKLIALHIIFQLRVLTNIVYIISIIKNYL